ncbi:DNA repair protein RAD51 homolog 2 [Phoenix dactylifera]|uniref:DNA repair protein RAD51 homolog 2 n=1 Tax=Phoenix dactylifera TaxID=42345 RepID=A0A8B9A0T2_PHODC|nr:DNA repair protein RAD51 homolog 2 [Phoenix dactylifera]XP_008792412.2 DNA repair protein RAD51 homolog 2 [Phoenix dactylifera]XP_008792421.2 DNA repair protein RAD51 homolog 2 [Phoenix dactylifera]XP_038980191.1 DNA repair protein RAD51 homolog 2 [Phoenix dactylifera]
MANKLISQMGLPPSVANVFAARNILTAKDALSLPEFELMTLLGMGLDQVKSAVERISEITCPPYQTALSLMEDRVRLGGHLPTLLRGLDDALCGGIPFGALTELVGPSGIGKTQFCLKLSLLAALPSCYGGLNGRVIYIDTESKFSSRRMVEIGENSFPQIFQSEGMAQQMAGRIIVVRLTSLPEFTERLQQLKLTLIQHDVKLLVVDSMAALVSGGNDTRTAGPKQHLLRWPLSFLKSLAEFSRIPVVVTNQVRSQSSNEAFHYPFQGKEKDSSKNFERLESHLIAALGIQWAHAVTIRLVFEAYSGQKFIKVAKSPMSPARAFPFIVESSGISLLNDDGFKVMGREINTIRFQGHNILEQ